VFSIPVNVIYLLNVKLITYIYKDELTKSRNRIPNNFISNKSSRRIYEIQILD
jgi:hypothetical protein